MFSRKRRTTRSLLNFEALETRRVMAAVSIADLVGTAGTSQQVPINIDTASGVRGAEIRLAYNTQLLDLSSGSVSLGSVWSGNADAQITASVDDAAGTVVIFISSATPLGAAGGSLANLNFAIGSGAATGTVIALDLVEVVLNEGAISVTPTPVAAADSTDGQITVTGQSQGTDRISGFVFADADANGSLGAGEAIPGVVIRLTNTTSGAVQQTSTASDGSYAFTGLAAGNYRIDEVHPVAFINQSSDSLTVQLTTGTALENQNFVERGLRAASLYTRLLTTLVQPVGSNPWQTEVRQITSDAASGTISPPTLVSPAQSNIAATSLTSLVTSNASDSSSELAAEGEADGIASQVWYAPVVGSTARADDPFERQRLAAVDLAFATLWF